MGQPIDKSHESRTAGTDEPRPCGWEQRLAIWLIGVCGIAILVAFQVPVFGWTVEYGFRNDSGKAAIQTFWNVLSFTADVATISAFTAVRPCRWRWAFIVPVGLAILWFVLVPVAFVCSGVLHGGFGIGL
jgi:hypothetical protein